MSVFGYRGGLGVGNALTNGLEAGQWQPTLGGRDGEPLPVLLNPPTTSLAAGVASVVLTAALVVLSSPVTVAAGASSCTLTAPTAAVVLGGAEATLAAGATTLLMTAPAAVVSPSGVLRSSGVTVMTVTAPTIAFLHPVGVPAGAAVTTMTAPEALITVDLLRPWTIWLGLSGQILGGWDIDG